MVQRIADRLFSPDVALLANLGLVVTGSILVLVGLLDTVTGMVMVIFGLAGAAIVLYAGREGDSADR